MKSKETATTSSRWRVPFPGWGDGPVFLPFVLAMLAGAIGPVPLQAADANNDFAAKIQPLMKKYCLDCHSTAARKGSLDLERVVSVDLIRKDLMPWQQLIEQIEAGEMPPKDKPQPTADERKLLLDWARGVLDAEAHSRAGDPGHVPLRRLSNTEYDCTIRDLTGIDLRPTREFPADGAAGEGFTNAAESLADVSPTLLNKYLLAASDIADHAVLLPDGFRFSSTTTRGDWTDESARRLRDFYGKLVGGDGKLQVERYLEVALRHRDAIQAGTISAEDVASKENLNKKYFGILWNPLQDKTLSSPLDDVRSHWRTAKPEDVPALTAKVVAWQTELWKTVRVGSYVQTREKGGYVESLTRQIAADPTPVQSVPLKVAVKPAPGQTDVVLYLASRELASAGGGRVVWHRPRFEATGKSPLLLKDYAKFGPEFDIDFPSIFANSAMYLAASMEAANDRSLSLETLAKKYELNFVLLRRWADVLDLELLDKDEISKTTPAVTVGLLESTTSVNERKSINGWVKKDADFPVLVTNSSDKIEQIPDQMSPHSVAVHPSPNEFVAVKWQSPLTGNARVAVRLKHAHADCGNGVEWWLEYRSAGRSKSLVEGTIGVGKEANPPPRTVKIEKGEVILLAVDARDGNHSCDLTEINIVVTFPDQTERVWNLAADVADSILNGNPHADRHGYANTWCFVSGASKNARGVSDVDKLIPPDSVLGEWRKAAMDRGRRAEAASLATKVQALLSNPPPVKATDSDRKLYDNLLSTDGKLSMWMDIPALVKKRSEAKLYGLAKDRFGTPAGAEPVNAASIVADADSVTEIRLPAALFLRYEFMVDGRLADAAGDRVVQFQIMTAAPGPGTVWPSGSVVASPESTGFKQFVLGRDDFRRVFPTFLCFPGVIPTDEPMSLKMFHREDEPLFRLFLDADQQKRLDHLWDEHKFISRQAVAENNYFPLFIGFVSQDQPKGMIQFFECQRPVFQKRADEQLKFEESSIPRQLDQLLEFAARAYRHPLSDQERTGLLELYAAIRQGGLDHEGAFRGVLARVLVSPAFLFRIEQVPAGKERQPVNDWELATRLSYFLWSSVPDEELRNLASTGQLHDPKILADQVQRMLKDARLRSLAVEFGTQWIHVRGFDEFQEKNETLFPTFNADFRKSVYEESILFFQDLFQSDRAVTQVLDADYTFLNESLAKHYGIPGVTGPQWRRVDGVQKFGRGGVLGLASVQARQAGASRSSPVLRGNWVVETLLGEKLPRPPADVPRLPEEEGDGGLTMRQQVEKHAKSPSCAACHVRIDPYGFALEKYDSIGRLRGKDLGGLEVDVKAKLRDGTEFEGLDGLRTFLLTKKKDVVVRLFCRRLLGYALGRAVTLSDTALLDEMVAELNQGEGRVSTVVQAIVGSSQFRMIRGGEYSE